MGYTERPASLSHLKIPLSSVGSLHTLHPPTIASGLLVTLGFPAGSDGEEPACNAGDMGWIWVGKTPWRREWHPTPVFLPREFHGQRSLAGYSPQGCKESDTAEWECFHFLMMLIFLSIGWAKEPSSEAGHMASSGGSAWPLLVPHGFTSTPTLLHTKGLHPLTTMTSCF